MILLTVFFMMGLGFGPLCAEEIWLYNNKRVYGMVNSIKDQGKSLSVLLPTGKEQIIQFEDIVAITFLGRNPLLIQSGTQEFRFVNGSRLRAKIVANEANAVVSETSVAGIVKFDLKGLKGFVALPMSGYSGLKAEGLVESEAAKKTRFNDYVIDRRGSVYSGVLREFQRTHVMLDIDDLLQVIPIKIMYLKGVRLADTTKIREDKWTGQLLIYASCRDGSLIKGKLDNIRFKKWYLRPQWNKEAFVQINLDEISQVQVQGGKVQYLSQLKPVKVVEKTTLAPPQPYQINRSCQKDELSIAGRRYPWGIGVHSNSEISYDINKRYKEFRSEIGIDTSMGDRGSVVFHVLGDGKELYKSPLIKGTDPEPKKVRVPIQGVKILTLKVTNGGDLDLGDVANWGSARVLRVLPGETK